MAPFRWLAFAIAVSAVGASGSSQPAERVFNVGVVYGQISMAEIPANVYSRALVEGLREHGWVEGRNLRIHWRSAERQLARRPALIDDLLRIPVDVLVVHGNVAMAEALEKTKSVPIVHTAIFRPEEYVASLSRPAGNLTGLAVEAAREIEGKRLALLKQVAPGISRVAILNDGHLEPLRRETLEVARSLGLTVFHQRVDLGYDKGMGFDASANMAAAIDEAVARGANAVYVPESGFDLKDRQEQIRAPIERHRLPAVYWEQFSSENGGLVTLSHDSLARHRRAAYFVDRILRGSKPGDLPIEHPVKYELVVNLRAARAIGLTVPRSVLVQADRVIE